METHILGDSGPRKSNFDPLLAEKLTRYYAEHPEELDDKPEVSHAQSLPVSTGPLELIEGDYLTAIQAAVPETIQTSAELQKARVELNAGGDTSLNVGFYTANVPLYGVENKKPFLLFGGREAFLRLYAPHIEAVYKQIVECGTYTLPDADKAWVLEEGIRSEALKRFDLAELIDRKESEDGCFIIDTKKCAQLKGAKRKLAELIHGQGNDYFNTFKMLSEKGISEIKVWLLNIDYVPSSIWNNLVGRASWLVNFNLNSDFSAVVRNVDCDAPVRGVRKK